MKRRSTLYHLDGERGFRGGERQLLYLAAALRARGRRNVVYCRAGGELEAEARRQGFEVRPLSTFGLMKDARREGAVVHAHTGRTAGFAVWSRLASIPFVAHRRVDFPVGFVASRWKYGLAAKTVAVSSAPICATVKVLKAEADSAFNWLGESAAAWASVRAAISA